MSLVTLVDADDTILGFKPRTQVTNVDCWRIASLWIVNSTGQVLVAQRSLQKPQSPGLLGPSVAGTVEGEESYHDTIRREAQEELGILLPNLTTVDKIHYRSSDVGSRVCQWFIAHLDIALDAITLQPEEVAQVYWQDVPSLLADHQAHPLRYVSGIGIEILKQVG